jgi:tetratricopeptide (TPR) repeat protein
MRQRLLVEFGSALRDLRYKAGAPSYADLSRLDPLLRRSTMSDVLGGKSLPSAEFVRAFVRACARFAATQGHPLDCPDADQARWHQRWLELHSAVEQLARRLREASSRTPPAAAAPPVPRQLPPANRVFVGRLAEREALSALSRTLVRGAPCVAAIHGMGGCGKSELALRWCHDVADEYPDGQLYVNLGGSSPAGPVEAPFVLDAFIYALGGTSATDDLAQLAAQFRSLAAGRRMIVVLDDAADAEQVTWLLPASEGALVLVTSRNRLPELDVDTGAVSIPVEPLDSDSGVSLLQQLIPVQASADPASARRLVALCGGTPLAIRLAAQSLQSGATLAALCDALDSLKRRVRTLDDGVRQGSTRLRTVLRTSCDALGAAARAMLSVLASIPVAEFSVDVVAAAAGKPLRQVMTLLGELDDANLLERAGERRLKLHELVRAYVVEEDGADQHVRQLVFSWYVHTAAAAAAAILPQRGPVPLPDLVHDLMPMGFGSFDAADAWFGAELPALVTVTRAAHDAGDHMTATVLPNVALSYLNLRKPWSAWLTLFGIAESSARQSGDAMTMAAASNALGIACRELRRFADAEHHLKAAIAAYRAAGSDVGLSMALTNLGKVLDEQDRSAEALTAMREALELVERSDDRWRRSIAVNNLADIEAEHGNPDKAIRLAEEALSLCRSLQDLAGEGCALAAIGRARRRKDDPGGALEAFRAAIERSTAADDEYNRALTEHSLAQLLFELADLDGAIEAANSALTILSKLADPAAEQVRMFALQLASQR